MVVIFNGAPAESKAAALDKPLTRVGPPQPSQLKPPPAGPLHKDCTPTLDELDQLHPPNLSRLRAGMFLTRAPSSCCLKSGAPPPPPPTLHELVPAPFLTRVGELASTESACRLPCLPCHCPALTCPALPQLVKGWGVQLARREGKDLRSILDFHSVGGARGGRHGASRLALPRLPRTRFLPLAKPCSAWRLSSP